MYSPNSIELATVNPLTSKICESKEVPPLTPILKVLVVSSYVKPVIVSPPSVKVDASLYSTSPVLLFLTNSAVSLLFNVGV